MAEEYDNQWTQSNREEVWVCVLCSEVNEVENWREGLQVTLPSKKRSCQEQSCKTWEYRWAVLQGGCQDDALALVFLLFFIFPLIPLLFFPKNFCLSLTPSWNLCKKKVTWVTLSCRLSCLQSLPLRPWERTGLMKSVHSLWLVLKGVHLGILTLQALYKIWKLNVSRPARENTDELLKCFNLMQIEEHKKKNSCRFFQCFLLYGAQHPCAFLCACLFYIVIWGCMFLWVFK